MSEIVEALPEDVRGAKGKYPWKLWLDGRVHLLKRGEDFHCATAKSFKSHVHVAAIRARIHVATRVRGDHLYVQAQVHHAAE